MTEPHGVEQPEIHPLIRELIPHGPGGVVSLAGYIGPSDRGVLRLYADLGLRTYVELPLDSVVRVVPDREDRNGPSVVLFRTEAEVTYTQTATMRVDQVLAAVASTPPSASSTGGCGCGGSCGGGAQELGALARQTGGTGGPTVDLCVWACVERMRLCEARSGTVGKLWCYLNYGFCRLGCIDPPVIVV